MTPDQKQAAEFAAFKKLPTVARNAAMRERLSRPDCGVNFSLEMHAQFISALSDCAAMGKAVGWKKSPSSMLSYGGAFFEYLRRDGERVARGETAPDNVKAQRRRWNNNGIARG